MKPTSLPTAAVVESLRRDQAYILGMTKLSSMIAREEPLDATDFPTCFNPRGDSYQSPAGSSSGSAAAVAAYDWADVGRMLELEVTRVEAEDGQPWQMGCGSSGRVMT